MGCHFPLQGIFPTQKLNPHLLHSELAGGFFTAESPQQGDLKESACNEDSLHFDKLLESGSLPAGTLARTEVCAATKKGKRARGLDSEKGVLQGGSGNLRL